ncbi:MAG TPA: hypothetical protein DDW31_03025 [candidate division Zixibacteria bacterium]|jgi:hypothetical protein|nr:hypothetical protein [candidate division Zixibacteria bacterium]
MGASFYHLRISVQQGFDGVVQPGASGDLKALMAKIEQQTAGVPEQLLEDEVHKEFSFVLCPRCREKFCANPLDLPLDIRHIPKRTSDLG